MNIDKSILKSLVLLILLVFSCENDSTNITSPSANNSNTTVPEGYIKIKANISSELKMNGLNVLGVGDSTIVENDSFEILHFDVKDFGFLYFFDDLGRVIALVLIDNSSENIVVSADKIAEAFIYFNPDIHLSNLKITEQIINNVKSGSTYSDFVSAVEQSINSRIPLEDINNEIFDHFIISIAEEVSRLENVGGRNQHDFDENLTIDVGENNGIEIFNGNVINIGINVIDETIQGDMESEIVSTLLVKPQKLEATPRLEDNCYLIYATSGDILSPNPADAQATRENLLFFSTSILKIAFGLVFTAVDGDCWKDFEENYVSAYLDLIKSGFSGEKPTFGFFLDRFIDTWDGFIKDIVLSLNCEGLLKGQLLPFIGKKSVQTLIKKIVLSYEGYQLGKFALKWWGYGTKRTHIQKLHNQGYNLCLRLIPDPNYKPQTFASNSSSDTETFFVTVNNDEEEAISGVTTQWRYVDPDHGEVTRDVVTNQHGLAELDIPIPKEDQEYSVVINLVDAENEHLDGSPITYEYIVEQQAQIVELTNPELNDIELSWIHYPNFQDQEIIIINFEGFGSDGSRWVVEVQYLENYEPSPNVIPPGSVFIYKTDPKTYCFSNQDGCLAQFDPKFEFEKVEFGNEQWIEGTFTGNSGPEIWDCSGSPSCSNIPVEGSFSFKAGSCPGRFSELCNQ